MSTQQSAAEQAAEAHIDGWMDRAYDAVTHRYRVVRSGICWNVAVGDGGQIAGRFYSKTKAERIAAALRTAFLDGAFVSAMAASQGGES